jgi:hypothetical protein
MRAIARIISFIMYGEAKAMAELPHKPMYTAMLKQKERSLCVWRMFRLSRYSRRSKSNYLERIPYNG